MFRKLTFPVLLLVASSILAACNVTVVQGEQYRVPVSGTKVQYQHEYRLHLIKHNPRCDGMGLRLYMDDRANYERRLRYEVYTLGGRWLGDGSINTRGETAIDFRGHDQVVVVFDRRIARYYRNYGVRPAVMLGSWERWQNRPVWVHGTIPLYKLMRTGDQTIDLRAGRRFCQ